MVEALGDAVHLDNERLNQSQPRAITKPETALRIYSLSFILKVTISSREQERLHVRTWGEHLDHVDDVRKPRFHLPAVLPFPNDVHTNTAFFHVLPTNRKPIYFSRGTVIATGDACMIETIDYARYEPGDRAKAQKKALDLLSDKAGIITQSEHWDPEKDKESMAERTTHIVQEAGKTFSTVKWRSPRFSDYHFRRFLFFNLIQGLCEIQNLG